MSARETLAMFVAGGNMRDAEPSPTMDKDKLQDVQQRLADLNAGKKPIPANGAPSDFRAGVAAREAAAAAAEAKKRGADVPRWNENHPVMKPIYKVHDAIASMPAPGGIAAILLAIFVLFVVLIPTTTSGETRALMLWEVLMGKKEVPPLPIKTSGAPGSLLEQAAQAAQQAAQGDTGKGSSTVSTAAAMPFLVSESVYHPVPEAPEGL
jgi:hypothetical protein